MTIQLFRFLRFSAAIQQFTRSKAMRPSLPTSPKTTRSTCTGMMNLRGLRQERSPGQAGGPRTTATDRSKAICEVANGVLTKSCP